MILKYLMTMLFLGTAVQAKTLSEAILDEKLKQKENYVFSNTSVDGLLSLISFGLHPAAQAELVSYWSGMSLDKKATTISSLKEKSPGVNILFGYQIWVDKSYSLLPSYAKKVSSKFSVVPAKMDVGKPSEVVNRVNTWAAKNTNNLITNVINQDFVTPDLATILANAIYFKGEWKDKFKKEYTEPKKFHGAGLVDTMTNYESYNLAYNQKDKVVVVELPFKGEKYSMVIAMPTKFTGFEFENGIEPEFSYKSGKNIKKVFKEYIINSQATKELANSEFGTEDLSLELPKFSIETSIENIEDKLSQIGLSSLFQSGALTYMSRDNLQISSMLQKAKIIVNEEGAEAAAVSVGGAIAVSASIPISMKINGPFAYMIRNNKTNEKLFEGVVLNPAQ
jgi:serine protease inhibitor